MLYRSRVPNEIDNYCIVWNIIRTSTLHCTSDLKWLQSISDECYNLTDCVSRLVIHSNLLKFLNCSMDKILFKIIFIPDKGGELFLARMFPRAISFALSAYVSTSLKRAIADPVKSSPSGKRLVMLGRFRRNSIVGRHQNPFTEQPSFLFDHLITQNNSTQFI